MSGVIGILNDLYVRFMVWLGAEPPAGYEYLVGVEKGPKAYTLKEGDTLFSVARKFSVHYERLA
ncbi:MAG TPA: LysM peptidoglycan-binding domain-containing protein, partial [Anaerolineae bacterium]|nr:LysM peptidoglycan-binding domain-containing protein [Anaerolineae bacterium]